jgi:hypothetical protein
VRLEPIKRLQADGHTLIDIGRIRSGPCAARSAMESPTAWWRYAVADDVMVWMKDAASSWRTKQLRAAQISIYVEGGLENLFDPPPAAGWRHTGVRKCVGTRALSRLFRVVSQQADGSDATQRATSKHAKSGKQKNGGEAGP